MNFSLQKWIPCLLCCCVLFFAVTADSVSCSVVTGGYDGNRPPVTIEHKFVSHASSVGLLKNDAPSSALILVTADRPQIGPIRTSTTITSQFETASLALFAPLRC